MLNTKLTALIVAAFATAGLTASPAFSQDTEPAPEPPVVQTLDDDHAQAARSLIRQLGPLQANGEVFYTTFATSAVEGFETQISRSLTDEERQQLYRFWYEKIQTALTSEELEDRLVAVYVRDFTREELTAIHQFYQSPAGVKWQSTLPDLQRELGAIGSNYIRTLSSDSDWLNSTLNELLTEIPSLADAQ